MELKRLSEKTKKLFKILMLINLVIVLSLVFWYFFTYVINTGKDNFFRSYVFLPLLLALLGTLIMLMSVLSNSSSFKSNTTADKTMFMIGIIVEVLAIIAIFAQILINRMR
jgi:uncharacterized membrane protein